MGLQFRRYQTYAAVIKYTGEDVHVIIPDTYDNLPVTKICSKAFLGNHRVLSVIIPETLEVIGRSAFEDCQKLRCITTKAGLEQDEPDCSRMPRTLCLVDNRAFWGAGLERVVFPASMLHLGSSAFESCGRLKLVQLEGEGTVRLGEYAFAKSALSEFQGSKMTTPMIPSYAFSYCKKLHTVTLNSRRLGFCCFEGCERLQTLQLGGTVEFMELGALNGCKMLDTKAIPPEARVERPLLHVQPRSTTAAAPASKPEPPPEPEPVVRDDCLFHLCQDYPLPLTGRQPKDFLGKILALQDKFFFEARKEEKLDYSILRCRLPEGRGIERLLTLVANSDRMVGVSGVWIGKNFLVRDMYPFLGEGYSSHAGSSGFFQAVLERINSPVTVANPCSGRKPPLQIDYRDEMELLLELCQAYTPQWVYRAYQRNLASARKLDDPYERKHGEWAMRLLVNIVWTPKPLKLPPMQEAEKMLDASFYGMRQVKNCVLETLSQIRRTGVLPKWGILLAGPAGTGKTSVAMAIARILSLPLIPLDFSSLGTEASPICGTPRIYYNARPGLILEHMYQNRSSSAVLLANEIDKVADANSTARNTLLTVLDKTGFYENFLEETIPTDNLFCVATCNDLETIPVPLRDRFQVIELPGYTYAEKQVIWNRFSLPLAMEQAAVHAGEITVTPEAETLLLQEYAPEPGVRDLERIAQRLVGNYCRLAEGPAFGGYVYTPERLRELLGPGRRQKQIFLAYPGKVQGAVLTGSQVQLYTVEAKFSPGNGKFRVLGNLDDAQRSYCQAAYYCLRGGCSLELSMADMTVFFHGDLPRDCGNQVGLACYMAMQSSILKTNLASRSICFLGGCDLSGSAYLPAIHPAALQALEAAGITKVYAPLGTSACLDPRGVEDSTLTIMEAEDAWMLFAFAASSANNEA